MAKYQPSDPDCENTAVFEMKQALADFMKPTPGSVRSQLSFGGLAAGGDVSVTSGESRRQSGVSVQQLIDNEHKAKERHLQLLSAKSRITELQDQVTSLETSRKRARVEYDRDVDTLRSQAARDADTAEKLKTQLAMLLRRDEDVQEQLKQTRAELRAAKAAADRRVAELQRDKHQLQMDCQQVEQDASSKQLELKNTILRRDSELQIAKLKQEETDLQLQKALKRYSDAQVELQQSEQNRVLAAEQKVKELEQQISRMESDAVIARTMKGQLDRLQGLEKENRKLSTENNYWKETQDNTFLLREEASSLRQKLERSEKRCADFTRLQLENQDMSKRLAQWEALNDQNNRPLSPTMMTHRVSNLQTSNASLLEQQGELQASCHQLESSLSVSEGQLKQTREQLVKEQVKGQQLEQLMGRLRKKLLLISKERDSYKGILDSYESEMTTNTTTAGSAGVTQLQGALASHQHHIAALEAELERGGAELAGLRTQNRLLENEVQTARQTTKRKSIGGQQENAVMLQLREQVANLEKRLEEVQAAKQEVEDELERNTLLGGYDRAHTKVIHMTFNPVEMARKRREVELSALREENKKLATRVELLEKREESLEDLTVKVEARLDQPSSSKEMEEMSSQLKSAELKNQRLMEVFKKKSHELREAVYQLLGFMIHIPCDNQYRLMNMYAETPNDFLLFQQDSAGQFQLLSTDYSSSLTDKIETYLTNGNSIPAFLSSVTNDLFSRQTMLQ